MKKILKIVLVLMMTFGLQINQLKNIKKCSYFNNTETIICYCNYEKLQESEINEKQSARYGNSFLKSQQQ